MTIETKRNAELLKPHYTRVQSTNIRVFLDSTRIHDESGDGRGWRRSAGFSIYARPTPWGRIFSGPCCLCHVSLLKLDLEVGIEDR